MKKFWIVFLIVALLVGGGMGLFWRALHSLDETPDIAGGVLVWRVDMDYPEQRDPDFLQQLLHGRALVLSDVLFGLERASQDDRIEALLLDIRGLPTDWAKVEELSAAVRSFAATGKPVIAHLAGGGSRAYALACAAGEITVPPEGAVMILGVSAELTFLKDSLAKLGIRADFVHVGRYKSAPEQLTRDSASAANREMTESLVADRYERLVATIAAGREVTDAVARDWIDTGLFDAPSALAADLVDDVTYADDLLERRFASDDVTYFEDYVRAGGRGRTDHKVALIYVAGTIMPGQSRRDRLLGTVAGSETVVERLRTAAEDDRVDAVLLRVDSPGGSALASDLIWHEIAQVREHKPVIVSMSGYAASGGYYVSCGADSIFADPGTLTGSIGVFAGKVDMTGLYEKLGAHREFVTRGENALLLHNHALFTPQQRDLLQGQLDRFYERFLAKVSEGRKLSPQEVRAVAAGRVWSGEQARDHGLVDVLGGLARALTAAKWMIGLTPSDRVSVVTYEPQLSFLQRMVLQSLQPSVGVGVALTEPLPSRLIADFIEPLGGARAVAAAALLDGQPVALPPFRIVVE